MICKSDLLLGDIVILRCGMRYVICNTCKGIRLLRNNGFQYLEDYNEELMYIRNGKQEKTSWDIVKIYRPVKEALKITYSDSICNLKNIGLDFYNFDYVLSKSEMIPKSNNFINISLYV